MRAVTDDDVHIDSRVIAHIVGDVVEGVLEEERGIVEDGVEADIIVAEVVLVAGVDVQRCHIHR